MDSCSSCRRPLDGALVCPGCGAWAPDIDPRSTTSRARRPAAATAVREKTAPAGDVDTVAEPDVDALVRTGAREVGAVVRVEAPAGGGGAAEAGGGQAGEEDAAAAGEGTAGTDAGFPALHVGRAGRRLQLARWSRSRRRAAAATALALLGGGITLGAMASGPARAPHPASAPDPSAPPPSAAPPTSAGGATARTPPDHQAPPSTAGALSPSADGGSPPYTPHGPYAPAATVRTPQAGPWRTASGTAGGPASGAGAGTGTPSAPGTPATPGTPGIPGTMPPTAPTPGPSPHHLCILLVCLP